MEDFKFSPPRPLATPPLKGGEFRAALKLKYRKLR